MSLPVLDDVMFGMHGAAVQIFPRGHKVIIVEDECIHVSDAYWSNRDDYREMSLGCGKSYISQTIPFPVLTLAVSHMASYALYSALLLTRDVFSLVKISALRRE